MNWLWNMMQVPQHLTHMARNQALQLATVYE